MERIPAAVLREIAVKARVDPATVRKVWLGLPVKGDAQTRAIEALQAAGFKPKKRSA